MTVNQKLAFLTAAIDHLRLRKGADARHYLVLIALLRYCSGFDPAECWPSRDTIARCAKCSVRTIDPVLADLKAWGVITTKQRSNTSLFYTVYWQLLAGADHLKAAIAKSTYDEDTEFEDTNDPYSGGDGIEGNGIGRNSIGGKEIDGKDH
jgi:hypothetical protein